MRILLLTSLMLATTASAQTGAVHRTTLQEQHFPDPAYDTVTVRTIVDTGGTVAAHTHPGAEMAYVVSGSAVLTVAGAPPRALASGDSFTVAQGTVHTLKNGSAGPLTVVSTYVVERGKAIAAPAR